MVEIRLVSSVSELLCSSSPEGARALVHVGFSEKKAESWVVLSVVVGEEDKV